MHRIIRFLTSREFWLGSYATTICADGVFTAIGISALTLQREGNVFVQQAVLQGNPLLGFFPVIGTAIVIAFFFVLWNPKFLHREKLSKILRVCIFLTAWLVIIAQWIMGPIGWLTAII